MENIELLRKELEKRTFKGSMEVASVGHQRDAQVKREAFKEALALLNKYFPPIDAIKDAIHVES